MTRDQLRLEVGEFGVPALYVRPVEVGDWMANFRLPPGLGSGWAAVRLRFADSGFGDTKLRIAVDLPPRVDGLKLQGVCDGKTWNAQEVRASDGEFMSCWVGGLPGELRPGERGGVPGGDEASRGICGGTGCGGNAADQRGTGGGYGQRAADVPGGVRRREHGGTGNEGGLGHVQIKKDQPGPGHHHGLMSSVAIGLIVFACVFGGALLGIFLRGVLPPHHLSAGTKDIVRLGMGLVGTMAALVLGLLVASAKGSYDAQSNELTELAANAGIPGSPAGTLRAGSQGSARRTARSGWAHSRRRVA